MDENYFIESQGDNQNRFHENLNSNFVVNFTKFSKKLLKDLKKTSSILCHSCYIQYTVIHRIDNIKLVVYSSTRRILTYLHNIHKNASL